MKINSKMSLKERFEASYIPEPNSGCWIWERHVRQSSDGDGRPRMFHKGKRLYAYRVAYELYIGPIPKGMFCCHRCDISICVNPHHLFLGTAKDNNADSAKKGRAGFQKYAEEFSARMSALRRPKGYTLPGKLTQEQKDQIIERRMAGESCNSIAKFYGVGQSAIWCFLNREYAKQRMKK